MAEKLKSLFKKSDAPAQIPKDIDYQTLKKDEAIQLIIKQQKQINIQVEQLDKQKVQLVDVQQTAQALKDQTRELKKQLSAFNNKLIENQALLDERQKQNEALTSALQESKMSILRQEKVIEKYQLELQERNLETGNNEAPTVDLDAQELDDITQKVKYEAIQLQLDAIQQQNENIAGENQQLKDQLERVYQAQKENDASHQNVVRELQDKIDGLQLQYEKEQESNQKNIEQLVQIEKQLRESNFTNKQLNSKIGQMEEELARLNLNEAVREQENEALIENEELKQKIEQLKQQNKDLKSLNETYHAQVNKQSNALLQMENRAQQIQEDYDELQEEYKLNNSNFFKEKDELQQSNQHLQSEVTQIRGEAQKARLETIAMQDRLQAKIDDLEWQLAKRGSEVDNLKETNERLSSQLNNSENDEIISGLEQRIQDQTAQISKLNQQIVVIQQENKEFQQQIIASSSSMKQMQHSQQLLNVLEQKHNTLQSNYSRAQIQLIRLYKTFLIGYYTENKLFEKMQNLQNIDGSQEQELRMLEQLFNQIDK